MTPPEGQPQVPDDSATAARRPRPRGQTAASSSTAPHRAPPSGSAVSVRGLRIRIGCAGTCRPTAAIRPSPLGGGRLLAPDGLLARILEDFPRPVWVVD